MSSGMLPAYWKFPSTASGAAKFLCFPGIPFLLIFVVFLLAAGMVVDAAVAEVANPILVPEYWCDSIQVLVSCSVVVWVLLLSEV